MAAVITLQSSSAAGPAAPSFQQQQQQPQSQSQPHSPDSQSSHRRRLSRAQQQQDRPPSTPLSPVSSSTLTASAARAPGRDGPSCDACLRRKSRCAMNEMVKKCYSCDFHRQECTFNLSSGATRPNTAEPLSKKRKLEDSVPEDAESVKRPSTVASTKQGQGHYLVPGFFDQSIQYIGLTTEFEPALLDHVPLDHNNEGIVSNFRLRKLGDDTYIRVRNTMPDSVSVDAIESLVAPYGATLIEKFFEYVHPTFPILMEDTFRQTYRTRKNLSPLLLAAVYVLTLKFVDMPASQSVRRPDVARLESTALKLLTESLPRATVATIQAGLLLMEKSTVATRALNAQLVTAGFELGLHQDCTHWRMDTWEKGLRKRLAWALYMQDKWSSLVHGRPSHIFAWNWTVKDLVEQDFIDAFHADTNQDDTSVGHGPLYFCHMVALTTILSDILDRFYTLQAIEDFKASGGNRTRMILERAKPAQIRLKEWFGRLPPQLKMDTSGDLFDTITEENARNGALHLSYFATEITLHRCIIRSLSPETADAYLSHICRSAAKTRLISAMDFVNRLRPAHLRSFWPSASRHNFTLIGSFGILLRVTAPTKEESEFYRLRLCEYRWTLSVSRKNAEFLDFSLDSLDNATNLDRYVPDKPAIDELMHSAVKPTITSRPVPIIALDDPDPMLEAGGTSSVISGLASPATSVSDESLRDTPIPPL